jgi:hypothetical protein
MSPRARTALMWILAVGIFIFSWLFRFNDPGGSFAGLTDDHFFYLVRGWQILFGDLPVRDFVDHGAPLFYYVGAAVQEVFGRGTLSELAFCTTVLSIGAAMTFWLCTTASGSIWAGLAGCFLHIWLGPRFYNYPKILVYAAALPLLWWFADRPSARLRAWIAVVTVIGFLFRHDHGAFIGLATTVLMLSVTTLRWKERLRHVLIYGLLVALLVAPYLAFIEYNGGLVSYFRQASAWAERDRDRAPVVWPGLFENPDGVSDAAKAGSRVAVLRDNSTAWMYYLEILLPFFALFVLAVSRDGFRPEWPHARAKLAMVAVLTAALDVGFLRSPLEARLADPSVPLVILVAWLAVALPRMWRGDASLQPVLRPGRWAVRGVASAVGAAIALLLMLVVSGDFYRRLEKAAMTERFGQAFERVGSVSEQLRLDWDLQSWASRTDRPDLITLAMYVNACTVPTDRILMQPYMPQVLALAQRAFAGGHADLRPGFFETEDAQRLTLARLQRQSVPVILLETEDSLRNFYQSFPIVTAPIDERYQLAATHLFDGRFGVSLYVRRDRSPVRIWQPLGWPCYGTGSDVAHSGVMIPIWATEPIKISATENTEITEATEVTKILATKDTKATKGIPASTVRSDSPFGAAACVAGRAVERLSVGSVISVTSLAY